MNPVIRNRKNASIEIVKLYGMRVLSTTSGTHPTAVPTERLSLVNRQFFSPAMPAEHMAPTHKGRSIPNPIARRRPMGNAIAYMAQEEPSAIVRKVNTRKKM